MTVVRMAVGRSGNRLYDLSDGSLVTGRPNEDTGLWSAEALLEDIEYNVCNGYTTSIAYERDEA